MNLCSIIININKYFDIVPILSNSYLYIVGANVSRNIGDSQMSSLQDRVVRVRKSRGWSVGRSVARLLAREHHRARASVDMP